METGNYILNNMSNTGIGQKLVEIGASAIKSTAQEARTTVSEVTGQLTGAEVRTDDEMQQIAAHDKAQSNTRISEIQQELAREKMKKMRRAQEVASWATTPSLPSSREHSSEQSSARSNLSSLQTQPNKPQVAESVRQAVGKSEQGRNFKG